MLCNIYQAFTAFDMSKEPVNINKIINEEKFKEYESLGLINATAVRNYKIKWDYYHLSKTLSMNDAITVLSEKYFRSHDLIISILYRKKTQNDKIYLTLLSNSHEPRI